MHPCSQCGGRRLCPPVSTTTPARSWPVDVPRSDLVALARRVSEWETRLERHTTETTRQIRNVDAAFTALDETVTALRMRLDRTPAAPTHAESAAIETAMRAAMDAYEKLYGQAVPDLHRFQTALQDAVALRFQQKGETC